MLLVAELVAHFCSEYGMPTDLEAGDPSRQPDVDRAILLLKEALEILDSVDRPDVAARLQDVIDRVSAAQAD